VAAAKEMAEPSVLMKSPTYSAKEDVAKLTGTPTAVVEGAPILTVLLSREYRRRWEHLCVLPSSRATMVAAGTYEVRTVGAMPTQREGRLEAWRDHVEERRYYNEGAVMEVLGKN
jgi:hypothetical protein